MAVGSDPSDKYKRFRQLGLLTTIPMILAAAPLVGYYLGRWLDRRFRTDPVLSLIMLGVGLAAGVRETILILKKAQDPDDKRP
jgi:ATP synthase protein I